MAVALGVSEAVADVTAFGYSREFEFEADDFTADAFARLNRDVTQIGRCLDQAGARPDPEPSPVFYSDPKWSAIRIAHLRLGTNGPQHAVENAYLGQVAGAIRRNIQFDLITRRFRTAVAAGKRLVAGDAPNPEDVCLLAESYFALGPRREDPRATQAAGDSRYIRKAAKWTEDEEFHHLAATPDGQDALRENQSRAESLFRRAAYADARLARPHAGLGMLFEQMGRKSDAAAEYRQFLELAPQAPDRARIERRLGALIR
jgi:tetratricopeptide (TPR) repeat protein